MGERMTDLKASFQRKPENHGALYLVAFINVLWKRKLFITVTAAIAGILGVGYSLIQPAYYLSQAVIVPPVSDQGYSNLSLGIDLPFDLSSSLLGSMNSEKDKAERYVLILESNRLRLAVIDSFDLARRYGFGKNRKPYFIEDVLRSFNRKALVGAVKGSVIITIIDKSPAVAAAIANFMICMLDSINKEITRTHMGSKKDFLYRRMMENRDSLALSENRLLDYEKRNGIIDLQKQAEVSVAAIMGGEADILARELQLSLNESKFSDNAAAVSEKKSDIKALRDELLNRAMKTGATLLIPPKKIPDKAITLARLHRIVAVHDILDKYLTKAYEEARLEERSTIPTIAVLDPPRVPQKRFKPKRRIIVLLFFGIGVGAGVLIAVMLDAFDPSAAAGIARRS